jgi:hypothetical protein
MRRDLVRTAGLRAHCSRNVALALSLAGFVVVVFVMTVIGLGGVAGQ